MLAALERLMVDCDVRSFEEFMDDLTNTALENDMEGMEGWDKNYLNGDMLKLLRIDCKKTEELIRTSPMHRAMEEHKMFSNWLRESTNALLFDIKVKTFLKKIIGQEPWLDPAVTPTLSIST